MRQIRRAANGNILGLHNSKLTKVLREFLFPSPQKAFQVGLVVKNLPANAGDIRDSGLIPGSGRSPGGGHDSTFQYSCLENPIDRGAWWLQSIGSHIESDTTERLHFHFSLSCIGKGNGTPLQCSCLENPRDRGAW